MSLAGSRWTDMDMKPKIEEWQKAYFAGLIDGEGCLSITKCKGQLTIVIGISMTTPQPLYDLRRYFGGSLIKVRRGNGTENWKPIYMWRVYSRKAEMVLEAIEPYLTVKEEQARVLREFRDHQKENIRSRGMSKKDDSHIIAFRECMKQKIHFLNRRGTG